MSDVIVLSRIQFALCVSFHYLFVPLSVGLSLMLVLMEGAYLKTKNLIYSSMTRFWVKIFALIFVLGVSTGLVQVFGFGTNWANFSIFSGDIFASLLGAEAIFAFFLESFFMAILLFGWHRVSEKIHFLSTIMVAIGAHMSAFWIVAANSWMQTPAGYVLKEEGGLIRAYMSNFWAVVHNFSTWDRFFHVVLGTWICGAFLVVAIHTYYYRKEENEDFGRKGLKLGLWIAGISLILQLYSADVTARGVAKNQPIKLAAFEGVYATKESTPIWLFGYVKDKKVIGVKIPGALSFLVHRNFKTPVQGLDTVNQELWPRVPIVFQFYHLMVFFWGIMVLLVIGGIIFLKQKRKLKIFAFALYSSVIIAEITNQLGWFAAEMGRQPWTVQGLLKTKDAISPIIYRHQVIQTIVMFSVIFFLMFCLFLFLLFKKIKHGPKKITY